jgi:hypothetical protein
MRHEFPTDNPEMWAELWERPRDRQLVLWLWQLPDDCSLDAYRESKRRLAAQRPRTPCRYGHTCGRNPSGECIECRRIKDTVRYRTARGIPLDAPLMRHGCTHGRLVRDCSECRNERRRARYAAKKEHAA